MGAYGKFEQFHGRPPEGSFELNFHPPAKLIFLGKAVAIEYECDKLNGGGDGKKAVYRHKFTTPAIVCMDERGKKQLYIIGPEIVVDERGIRK